MPPGVEVRRGGRQVQDHAADRADDVRPQFEEPVAQPRHLDAGTAGARRAQPEFLQEHEGGGREEHAQRHTRPNREHDLLLHQLQLQLPTQPAPRLTT